MYANFLRLFLEQSTCVDVTLPSDIPSLSGYMRVVTLHIRLLVQGTGQVFTDETRVNVRRRQTQLTFVQTDKPKYKPGQTGKPQTGRILAAILNL